MPEFKPVFSSVASHVAYEDGALFVRWKGGRVSVYGDAEKPVPPQLAADLHLEPSVGQVLRSAIMGVYPHRYLDGE